MRWTVARGLGGVEAWAGTPGTVGGAIYGNAHWQKANIGDVVESVRVAGRDGNLRQVDQDRMDFGYDTSRLQRSGETAIWVAFRVTPGQDPDALRTVARASLAFRKRTQPLASPSAGCIFQNPQSGRDRVPEGIPPSAGALVDRAGLKDHVSRRGAGVAHARQLHRQRRLGHGGGHRRAHRGVPRAGARGLRRRPARGDRQARRLVTDGIPSCRR